jgi:hypothetical protein
LVLLVEVVVECVVTAVGSVVETITPRLGDRECRDIGLDVEVGFGLATPAERPPTDIRGVEASLVDTAPVTVGGSSRRDVGHLFVDRSVDLGKEIRRLLIALDKARRLPDRGVLGF